MSLPFPFLPRAVSKYAKAGQGRTRPLKSSPVSPDATDDGQDGEHDSNGKEETIEPTHPKQSTLPQDIAALVSLALSDYNIWLDPDLRWKLDACLQDDVPPDDAAYVPISYLLRRPPFCGALSLANGQSDPSESEVVKALRTHASRTLQVRMHLPLPSSSATVPASSVWYSTGKTSRKKDVGGYEVRRTDWAMLHARPSREWTRSRWDDFTAYMECIPPRYRSIGGIARFAESLLSATAVDVSVDMTPRLHVQSVTLPPHYLDKPGDTPKCKGYALVTFLSHADLDCVLCAWPWQRSDPLVNHGDASPVVKEALKCGLRTISKARWDALNEEYLAYKHALVEEKAYTEVEMQREDSAADIHDHEGSKPRASPQTQQTEMQTTLSSPYPFDCLVFVRNVHPDTNKTMLKSLFSQAFQEQEQDGQVSMGGLDYVDFNKGTDSCYLRLASPSHTAHLLAYFTTHPKVQAQGLDATGRTPLTDDKPITTERVQGKREEVYWEKVPDKVRQQAVERVVQARQARRNGGSGSKRKKRTRE